MPYRYVLRWQRTEEKERIAVEAWPKKHLALEAERRGPSFVIGSVEGSRAVMLRPMVNELMRRYRNRQYTYTTRVDFPEDDLEAIAEAYRAGLSAAVVSEAHTAADAERSLQYILRAAREEVWFWASKMLSVVGDGHPTRRIVEALSIVSLSAADTSPPLSSDSRDASGVH